MLLCRTLIKFAHSTLLQFKLHEYLAINCGGYSRMKNALLNGEDEVKCKPLSAGYVAI